MLLTNFVELFLDSAPWLLLGLLFAGILKSFIPMAWMHKQLGNNNTSSIFKAALFGAPLPLCSCGVIPAAIGLRRAGASKSATTAFLVSTPETGVDSISVSYAMLGPFMAIIRPIAAITSAVLAGLLVGREDSLSNKQPSDHSEKKCCSSSTKSIEETSVKTELAKTSSAKQSNTRFSEKVIKGLKFSTSNLVRDISVWLLIGLFFAALIQTYVPASFLSQWGNGLIAMLVMVVISIPMYICATASTPVAAALLLSGVSPGAVLVFMLAGPATNIATLGVVYKELGKRSLIGYLSGVLIGALFFGWLTDILVANFVINVAPQIGHEHQLLPEVITISTGVFLAILIVKEYVKKIMTWRTA